MRTSRSQAWIRSGFIAAIVVLVAFASTPAAGQGRDAQIIGQVKDQGGGVLPGVTVTITSPALQVAQMVSVTNELGEYRVAALPIGSYEVTFELAGFQTVRRQGVQLTQGFTARIDVSLGLGGVTETVQVSGQSPVVDVASTSGSTRLTAQSLELTPTSRVGVASLLDLTPGVRTYLDVGGNNMAENPNATAFGQLGQTWYTIEGVALVDATRAFWDQQTLDEARVQTLGADAEFPTRGVQVTGAVKAGGNNFHGGGSWSQNNESFQSDNLSPELKDLGFSLGNSTHRQYDGFANLGGRIVRNKLWFYGAIRRRLLETNILNTFKPDGSPAYGVVRSTIGTAKLSYQPNPSNRFVFFTLNERNYEEKGADEFIAYESREAKTNHHPTYKGEWEGMRGSGLVAHLQYGFNSHDAPQPFINNPPLVPRIDLETERVTGDSVVLGEWAFRTTNDINGFVSWYKPNWAGGNHEFKSGFNTTLVRDSRRMQKKPINYGLLYNDGVPDQVAFFSSPVDPLESLNLFGFYLKDSWTIARSLTLNLGARFARENLFVPARCREESAYPSDVFFPQQCFSEVDTKVFNNIQPRLHAAYDLSGDGKTVVKGGWGRFYNQRVAGDGLPYDKNSLTYAIFQWRDLNGNNDWDPNETNRDPNGPDFIETTAMEFGSLAPNTIPNPDEKQTRTDEFTVSLERELVANFSLRATGIVSLVTNIKRRENILRPYDSYNIPINNIDPGPDGIVGTGDDGGVFTYYEFSTALNGAQFEEYMFVVDPRADQRFSSLEIAAVKRLSSRYQFTASYSATKRHKPTGIGDLNPNNDINQADDSWDWDAKITGTYLMPFDINLGGTWHQTSGNQFARQVQFRGGETIPSIVLNAEPFGTRRSPNINLVTFRAEKNFPMPNGQRVGVQLNVYNALNASTAAVNGVNPALQPRSGDSFLRPRAIMPPRLFELGVTYTF
jgi:Carboxypeptidase regulatory-like domain